MRPGGAGGLVHGAQWRNPPVRRRWQRLGTPQVPGRRRVSQRTRRFAGDARAWPLKDSAPREPLVGSSRRRCRARRGPQTALTSANVSVEMREGWSCAKRLGRFPRFSATWSVVKREADELDGDGQISGEDTGFRQRATMASAASIVSVGFGERRHGRCLAPGLGDDPGEGEGGQIVRETARHSRARRCTSYHDLGDPLKIHGFSVEATRRAGVYRRGAAPTKPLCQWMPSSSARLAAHGLPYSTACASPMRPWRKSLGEGSFAAQVSIPPLAVE